jgi:biotin carboxylase
MATLTSDAQVTVQRTADPAVLPSTGTSGAGRSASARSEPLRVLMVCNLFTMPYRVMRCAHAAGARIWVLGNEGARGITYSRYCQKFSLAKSPFDGESRSETAAEINRHVEELHIDLVMPGDAPSTRTLIALRDGVRARCFPMPDLYWFDRLNNKWEFRNICQGLGIRCPPTRLLADRDAVIGEIVAGRRTLPAIAKPINLEGGHGVIKLDRGDAIRQARAIDYTPVLLQDFIEGEDIGASVYCESGQVLSFIAHRLARKIYATFRSEEIESAVTKLMDFAGSDGVYNFDMRRTAEGLIYFLECNPRIFYKINLSMVAGINFTQRGIAPGAAMPASVPNGRRVRMPMAFAADVYKPWTLSVWDLAMMKYLYADPMPMVREWLRIDWED